MQVVVTLVQYMFLFLGPLWLAAMGAMFSGAGGIPAYGLEGMMVAGGFAAAAMGIGTGNFVLGLLAGIGAGMLAAALFFLCVVHLKAKPLPAGIGLHGAMLGLGMLLAQTAFGAVGETPEMQTSALLPRFTLSGMGDAGHVDAGTFLALAMIPVVALLFYRSRFGLRVRATGMSSRAVTLRGISVSRYQQLAVLLCGALAGLGGAVFVLGEAGGVFSMTTFQGLGYLALLTAAMGRDALLGTLWYGLCFGIAAALSRWGAQWLALTEDGQQFGMAVLILLLLVLVGRRAAKRARKEPTLSQDA